MEMRTYAPFGSEVQNLNFRWQATVSGREFLRPDWFGFGLETET